MGVMTAYSSHNSKSRTNVPLAEKIISLRLAIFKLWTFLSAIEIPSSLFL